MKDFALLFVAVWTFCLPLCELKAQDTVGTVMTQKEREAAICNADRAYFQAAPGLLNNSNGTVTGKGLISMGKGIAYRGRSNRTTSGELTRLLKKPSRPMIGTTQFYLIDTVIVHSTTDTERCSYSYNASGLATSALWERWYDSQCTNSVFDTMTYDGSRDLLTRLIKIWQNGQWTNSELDTFTYDASGHELTYFYEDWQNGQWTNGEFETMTYDAHGNELTDLYQVWLKGQWTNLAVDTMTYDASGHELTDLYEQWNNGQWTNFSLSTYTYDASGHKLADLFENWQNGQWTNSSRDTMTYDANGHELTYLEEQWFGHWTNEEFDTMTYDASGNELTDLEEEGGTNAYLYTYTYDASGNELTDLQEVWENGQWTNEYLETYTYDASGIIIAFSSESWQDSAWAALDSFVEIVDGPNYEYYYGCDLRITYKLTTGLSGNKPDVPAGFYLFQNYPDPFNPTTTIDYELSANSFVSLEVYDVLGRVVTTLVAETQTAGNHSVTLDASNLPSGVYFYRLQAGIYSNTKKLLLLK